MERVDQRPIDRRTVLAGLGSVGSAALAGCPACANSYRFYDDLLRVDLRDVEVSSDTFRGEAIVVHRGPDSWEWGDVERERFYTNYEDVTFLGYAHDGRRVAEVDMGDFEPSTTMRTSIEADGFPMVITAHPANVTYDVECPHADVGGQLDVYAGRYESVDPFEIDEPADHDPRSRVEMHLERHGPGHRWVPYGEFLASDEPPPSEESLWRAKCAQRSLAGREPGGPVDFTDLRPPAEWLERRETISFTVYGGNAYSGVERGRVQAVQVPERIAEIIRNTEWRSEENGSVTKSVSLDEWKRLVGILSGADGPTLPSCDKAQCSDGIEYGPNRGHCREGGVTVLYEFDPAPLVEETIEGSDRKKLYWAENSLVVMKYWWEGIPTSSS